jgi:mRNA-degrading endonuclease RelE of RelBE toxin-antitoxin system
MAIVRITLEARDQARKVPKPIQGRIAAIVSRLEKWPNVSGAKPLHDDLAGNFRLRTGDYRVIVRYDKPTDTVTIWRIGYRRDIYDQ